MNEIKFFEIIYNTDRTEGKGRITTTDICFTDAKDAYTYTQSTEFASKFGVMGTKGSNHNIDEITKTIYSSIADYESTNNVKLITPETIKQQELFNKFEGMSKDELVIALVQNEMNKMK